MMLVSQLWISPSHHHKHNHPGAMRGEQYDTEHLEGTQNIKKENILFDF